MKDEYPIRGVLEEFGFELKDDPGKVRCVFHDDTHASGMWNDYYYSCFACGAAGDAPRLLLTYKEGIDDWPAAYAEAARLSGAADTPLRDKSRAGRSLPRGEGHRGRGRSKATARGRR